MSDILNRRAFLQFAGMTLAVTAANPLFAQVRARGGRPSPRQSQVAGGNTLVVVFLRGGCDGLNTCIPIEPGEHALYQSYRPTLMLDRATDLAGTVVDPDFALHPSLAPMYSGLFQAGSLAVLPNVHYDNGSRSHFDSQLFYENGAPYDKNLASGWLSRHMASLPGNGDVLRAVVFGTSVPAALRGRPTALSFSNLQSLSVSGNTTRDNQFLDTQEQVYAMPLPGRRYDTDTLQAGADLVAAIRAIRAATLPAADPAATYPANSTFGNRLRELASLLKSGAFAIEVAEVDLGGFDTHTDQGALTGAQPNLFAELSQALNAFYTDLGAGLRPNVLTMVLSEFGRTARENSNRGTDHGSAMCAFVAGGAVVPGVHFGAAGWHGLSDLRDNRDLKHSADYRDVYIEVLQKHLGNPAAPSLFPGWTHSPIGILA